MVTDGIWKLKRTFSHLGEGEKKKTRKQKVGLGGEQGWHLKMKVSVNSRSEVGIHSQRCSLWGQSSSNNSNLSLRWPGQWLFCRGCRPERQRKTTGGRKQREKLDDNWRLMTLKKSQCSTSSGFCFGRTLLRVTWLGLLSTINVSAMTKRGKGQRWMLENAGQSCTSRNIQIRAGKSVFSTRAGREGEEAAQVSSRASGAAALKDLLVLLQPAKASAWGTAAVFIPLLTMEDIIPAQPCETLWSEYPNLRLHSIKACKFKEIYGYSYHKYSTFNSKPPNCCASCVLSALYTSVRSSVKVWGEKNSTAFPRKKTSFLILQLIRSLINPFDIHSVV